LGWALIVAFKASSLGSYNDLSGFLGTDAVDSSPRPAPGTSMFEELIYWTGTLTNEEIAVMEKDHRLLAKKALVLICSNWLTTLEYATTRIAQIEWEIENPSLRSLPKSLEESLKRLHRWRRVLPIYHGMVSDTKEGHQEGTLPPGNRQPDKWAPTKF